MAKNKTKVITNTFLAVRLKLNVHEIWDNKLKDKSSDTFKELATTLKKAIEDIYEEKSTEGSTIMAQVVEVRFVNRFHSLLENEDYSKLEIVKNLFNDFQKCVSTKKAPSFHEDKNFFKKTE